MHWKKNIASIIYSEQEVQFEHKMTFEFNSDRKMMSVVFMRGLEIVLYAKGAVSSMLPLIRKESEADDQKLHEEIYQFEKKGHRVLIMAYKIIRL